MSASQQGHGFSEAEYQRFADLVRAGSGLEIPSSRRTVLERAVRGLMAELNVASPGGLLSVLNDGTDHAAAVEDLVARLTIGETHFFRNRPQFEALKTLVLPQVIARRRGQKRLRLWSAGCATGEEPYSLAIMLESLLPDLADWDVRILGTDINRDCLAEARAGVYGARSFREVPEGIQSGSFTRTGAKFEISPRIRQMVNFSYLNLVMDDYPSLSSGTDALDLILCRNVLIYFSEATVRGVAKRLHACLDVGGWLVVGPAEPSQTVFHDFRAHNVPGAVLYRKTPVSAPDGAPLPHPGGRPAPTSQRTPTSRQTRAPMVPLVSAVPSSRVRAQPLIVATIKARTRLPDPAPAEIQPVLQLIRDEQPEIALERLVALSATYPHDIWVPYLLAKIHADRGELAEAEICIDRALAQAPLLTPAHHLRALILQELGRLEESLQALRRCIYADPQFWLGYLSMAGLLDHLAQPRKAHKVLRTLASLLAAQDSQTLVPQGGTMTVGRLREVVSEHTEQLRQ